MADVHEIASGASRQVTPRGIQYRGRSAAGPAGRRARGAPSPVHARSRSPGEITSHAGWPPDTPTADMRQIVSDLQDRGVRVSMFVDPDPDAMRWAASLGAARVELYTEPFARAFARSATRRRRASSSYVASAELAHDAGPRHQRRPRPRPAQPTLVPHVAHLDEVSIGHALMATRCSLDWSGPFGITSRRSEDDTRHVRRATCLRADVRLVTCDVLRAYVRTCDLSRACCVRTCGRAIWRLSRATCYVLACGRATCSRAACGRADVRFAAYHVRRSYGAYVRTCDLSRCCGADVLTCDLPLITCDVLRGYVRTCDLSRAACGRADVRLAAYHVRRATCLRANVLLVTCCVLTCDGARWLGSRWRLSTMSIDSPIVVAFLTVEDIDGVKEVVCREIVAHRNSDHRVTLTFNVYDLALDFASNTITISTV